MTDKKDMPVIKAFMDFLKENGVYDSYFLNMQKDKEFPEAMEPGKFIVSAFCWDYTREGQNHWFDINEKWQKRLDEIEKSSFWLARDKSEELWLYMDRPVRRNICYFPIKDSGALKLDGFNFPEVTWENGPRKVTVSIRLEEEEKDKDR